MPILASMSHYYFLFSSFIYLIPKYLCVVCQICTPNHAYFPSKISCRVIIIQEHKKLFDITTTIIAEWQKRTLFEHFMREKRPLYIIVEWQKHALFEQPWFDVLPLVVECEWGIDQVLERIVIDEEKAITHIPNISPQFLLFGYSWSS